MKSKKNKEKSLTDEEKWQKIDKQIELSEESLWEARNYRKFHPYTDDEIEKLIKEAEKARNRRKELGIL